jgi:hypothetical protein
VTKGFDIPPEAVRVWRGYRASTLALPDFFQRLGTVFVPATVEMQIDAGLDGYIPSVPGGLPDKPDSVPDETAILFWDSQQTYTDGFGTLAVRTYTLTHGAVYRPPSGAQFPVVYAGSLVSEQPYYLIARPADWMHGQVTHLIGGRPAAISPDQFRAALAPILSDIQRQGRVAGAIACAGDDYLVYWELAGPKPSDGVPALKAQLDWNQVLQPAPTRLTSSLHDAWPGMTVAAGASLNMQFERRWERADRTSRPVPSDAVHVWRGYKAAAISGDDFGKFLGGVFVPACALLQPRAGLHAYTPSMVPGGGTPTSPPDQTALMFWTDQQAYSDAFGTVAVRAYTNLHGGAYDTQRSKVGFPIPFAGAVAAEQAYHLFDGPADWMLGSVRHFVGAPPAGQAPDDFFKAVADWAVGYLRAPPEGVDAAILCAGPTYVAFWEHAAPGSPDDPLALDSLKAVATPSLSRTAETYVPPSGLWSQWPGIDLSAHGCINVQLDRPRHEPFRRGG